MSGASANRLEGVFEPQGLRLHGLLLSGSLPLQMRTTSELIKSWVNRAEEFRVKRSRSYKVSLRNLISVSCSAVETLKSSRCFSIDGRTSLHHLSCVHVHKHDLTHRNSVSVAANSLGNFAPQSFLTSGGGSVSAALALRFFRQPISFYNRKMLALVSVALRIARGGLSSLVASQLMTAAMGNSICTRLSSIRVFKANEKTLSYMIQLNLAMGMGILCIVIFGLPLGKL